MVAPNAPEHLAGVGHDARLDDARVQGIKRSCDAPAASDEFSTTAQTEACRGNCRWRSVQSQTMSPSQVPSAARIRHEGEPGVVSSRALECADARGYETKSSQAYTLTDVVEPVLARALVPAAEGRQWELVAQVAARHQSQERSDPSRDQPVPSSSRSPDGLSDFHPASRRPRASR